MKLKITIAEKIEKSIPVIFVISDEENIADQPLFRFLSEGERQYLQEVRSAIKPKYMEAKVTIMPKTGRKVILVGICPALEITTRKIGLAIRVAVQTMRREKIAKAAYFDISMHSSRHTQETFEVIAAAAVMANFEFIKYKTPPPEGFFFVKELVVIAKQSNADIIAGIRRGLIIGEETNECRMLANEPGGDMTPVMLAAHAVRAAKANGIRSAIFDEKKMRALGMGGVLGVGSGSDSPPRFIVLEYMKGPKKQKPIVLVGKGVTFDTGGLDLKSGDHMYEMHMDKSGGAAVIHAIVAAARLKLKKNIVALIPAVENMPSGSSYRPGDLLRTMNGKTIEVLNTDAEGRVILADALEYSKKYNPTLVIDVATLTGAAIGALGLYYSAIFTSDKKLEEKFCAIGEDVDDRVWPLPLTVEYEDGVKGTFGDWANTGKSGEGGGASAGAAFLWQFIKGYPWVHLDIAPRMTAAKTDYLAKGAAGAPVRLLVRYLMEQ